MVKVLYTTPEIMHPAVSGPFLRVENSIKALSRVAELYLVVRRAKVDLGGDSAETYYREFCKDLVYSPSTCKKKRNLLQKFINLFRGSKVYRGIIDDANFIIDYARKNNINIIWFGYGNISYHLMKLIHKKAPDLKLVCDTDSVWSRFVLRELPFTKDRKKYKQIEREGHVKEREEKAWTNFCDVTTAVSEVDADYYRSLISNDKDRIKIFSNVIDVDSYSENFPEPDGYKKPCIYFAGSYWPGCPMELAARWVISDVLPLVKVKIPHVHLYLIGNNSDNVLKDIKDENITITGRLESVLPYLCNASVSIVALKFESGTRFKILEAGACSVPIVSTTLGAEGIPVKNNENILIADDANDFADAIVKVLQNPIDAKSMAKNMKKYIEENYSIDKHMREAKEILNYLVRN